MVAVFSPALLTGLVRMIESEVKKLYLRVFVVIDVAMGSLIVGDVIEGHAGGLAAELVSNEGEAGSIEGGPDLLDIGVVGKMRLTDGERIHGNCQDTFQGGEAVLSDKERLDNMGPVALRGSEWKLIFIADKHGSIGSKAGRRGLLNYI
jgi:hypothetical protein